MGPNVEWVACGNIISQPKPILIYPLDLGCFISVADKSVNYHMRLIYSIELFAIQCPLYISFTFAIQYHFIVVNYCTFTLSVFLYLLYLNSIRNLYVNYIDSTVAW